MFEALELGVSTAQHLSLGHQPASLPRAYAGQ